MLKDPKKTCLVVDMETTEHDVGGGKETVASAVGSGDLKWPWTQAVLLIFVAQLLSHK